MKTPESTPASDHQLMQDQAELIVELRKQLRTAREALKAVQVLLTPMATHCHRVIAAAISQATGGGK